LVWFKAICGSIKSTVDGGERNEEQVGCPKWISPTSGGDSERSETTVSNGLGIESQIPDRYGS